MNDYLQLQWLHDFFPGQEHNDVATEACNLIEVGAQYANKSGASWNFKDTKFKTKNYGAQIDVDYVEEEHESSDEDRDELESCNIDAGPNLYADLNDLLLDKEEYPEGLDSAEVFSTVNEVIDKLCGMD